MSNPTEILLRPRVTEKSVHLQSAHNCYTFDVDPRATKTQVKDAVERLFKVDVTKVTVSNRDGKRRRNRAGIGYTARLKIARVTLADGQSIEGV